MADVSSKKREEYTDSVEHEATIAGGDLPLDQTVSDQPTINDLLGFRPYVDAITNFLTNPKTKAPLTLSVEGDWGCGKSSFMLQLREALKRRKHITVNFNSWRHDKEDALWAAFALEFLRQISRWYPHRRGWHRLLSIVLWPWYMLRRYIAHIRLCFRRFSWENGWLDAIRFVAVWLFIISGTVMVLVLLNEKGTQWFNDKLALKEINNGVGLWGKIVSLFARRRIVGLGANAASIAALASLWSGIRRLVGDPINISLKRYLKAPKYEDRVAFIEQFHRDFRKIVDIYAGKKKVYVFIDDLDRCEVPRAAELMQALNLLVSDDPHLIFIIGMDREKIAAGLAVKYETLLPYLSSISDTSCGLGNARHESNPLACIEYGYGFIEKFIQLPFRIPQPAELDQFLKAICSGDDTRLSDLPMINDGQQYPQRKYEVTNDYRTLNEIVDMVSETLDNNPRRLKQFVNLFRLRAFIAEETGILGSSIHPVLLGKFVAIEIKWPLLISELGANPRLLAQLEKHADNPARQIDDLKDDVGPDVKHWLERDNLQMLLTRKCDDPEHTFEKSDISKLLQVAPRVKVLVRPRSVEETGVTQAKSVEEKSDYRRGFFWTGKSRGGDTSDTKD